MTQGIITTEELLNTNLRIYFNNRGFCKQLLKDFDAACMDAKESERLGFDAQELIETVCD